MSLRGLALAVVAAGALLAPGAGAAGAAAPLGSPVASNPADLFASLDRPIDELTYDPATRCTHRVSTGARLLERWLSEHWRGESWGIERCEKWGRKSASLHAEGRAVDWHLDVAVPADRRAARRLIATLLATDEAGEPLALARRMGVQELIYDCRAWFGGEPVLRKYSVCFSRSGKRLRRVDRTAGHLDHVHIGLTKRGAAARTSFWQALRAGELD